MRGARTTTTTLLLLAAGCGGPTTVEAGEGMPRPDMIIACVDGVGMEHLTGGLPAFERMLEEGVVYTEAYATSPWAGEALAALVAGTVAPLPPQQGGAPDQDGPSDEDGEPEPRCPSLPEVLRHAGYRTAFVPAHPLHLSAVAERLGIDESLACFDTVLEVPGADDAAGARADDVARAASAWLGTQERPALVICCFADPAPPHHAYPELVDSLSGEYEGPVRAGLEHGELLRRAPSFTDADRTRLRALHASEVAAVERAFDRLAGLAVTRKARPPILALAGLRRPALGEGGRYGLLPSLEPDDLRVPVVIRFSTDIQDAPGPSGETDLPVSLVDLYPTLLDALGLPPRLDLDGRTVFPGALRPARPVLARTGRGIRGEVRLDVENRSR